MVTTLWRWANCRGMTWPQVLELAEAGKVPGFFTLGRHRLVRLSPDDIAEATRLMREASEREKTKLRPKKRAPQ